MDEITVKVIEMVLPVIVALLASSGFWIYIGNYKDRRSMQTELLIGLAHDRLISLGLTYITRGWITQDEYENFNVYLYRPYEKLGGNGSVKRIMLEVDTLPIRKDKLFDKITGDTIP
jgi:hypothetical protein